MEADIEIFDEPDAVELLETQGNIVFENVSFEYPDDHNIVFTGLDLNIRHGEKVAIVGPSGGGKTTLCNLIPRFYDVTEGRILIDGEDIRHFTLKTKISISASIICRKRSIPVIPRWNCSANSIIRRMVAIIVVT